MERLNLNDSPTKKARFSLDNATIIIPSRNDLFSSSESFSDLWWKPIELNRIQREAYEEMRSYVQQNKCNIKQGLKSLYQVQEFANCSDASDFTSSLVAPIPIRVKKRFTLNHDFFAST